jgi:hypothetical protein
MKRTLVLVILLASIVWSCKKSADVAHPKIPCLPYSVNEYKIREIVTFKDNNYYKSEYFYDSLGRVDHRRDSGEYFYEVFWQYTAGFINLRIEDSTVLE